MAATAVTEIVSLSRKGKELCLKGHWERSLLKWRDAVAAAEALGAEDSLIVASVKTSAVHYWAFNEAMRDGHFTQATVLEVFAQLAACVAILRRRRDAGTLQQGKCRPEEERWSLETLLHGRPLTASDAHLLSASSYVGYVVFLEVTSSCAALVIAALDEPTLPALEPGGEEERTWFSFTCDLCDEAVALMMQPREMKDYRSTEESSMFSRLRELKRALATGLEVHRGWHVQVSVALARLQRSGVLEERHITGREKNGRGDLRETLERGAQERKAAAAYGQLRRCALAGCGAREAHLRHFSKCGACKAVVYCCREHQLEDWLAHKAACKAARKAAAAKDAA